MHVNADPYLVSVLSAKPHRCKGVSISLFLFHAKRNIVEDDDNNKLLLL